MCIRDRLFSPHLLRTVGRGEFQFAYAPGRGARDAICHFLLEWFLAFFAAHPHCSASDKVSSQRLLQKLERAGVHPRIPAVLASWLDGRRAQ
eukprot:4940949-Pyramimonas_sp.AAC.1